MNTTNTKANAEQGTERMDFPRLELLTLLNLATPTLSKKSTFVDKVKKMFDKDMLLQVERDCFETSLPATVTLPPQMRENSIVLTAAFYLLHKKQTKLKTKERIIIAKEISETFHREVESMSIFLKEKEFQADVCETMFSLHPEIVAALFLVFTSELSEGIPDEPISKIWEGYTRFINPMQDAREGDAVSTVKKRDNFVGSHKNFGGYINTWMDTPSLSNPRKTLTTNPYILFSRAAMSAGMDFSSLVPDEILITKDESEIAARCAVYAQNEEVDFDAEKFRQEYTQMSDARADYNRAFLSAIMIRKAAAFYSREIISNLKQQMFGTEQQQKAFDKQLKSLQEARELTEKLREENAQLKAKASEIDSWKESFRKREYALKEQVASLTKQLEDANSQISELKIPMDAGKEVVSLDEALQEAGFEDIGQEQKTFHDELVEHEQKYRIIIAGGNENLMKKFRIMHPGIVIINDARIANCEAVVRNADILFFKTDCISHSLYDKCKDVASACKVPYSYIPETTSINLIEQIICEKIAEKLSTRREVGMYA